MQHLSDTILDYDLYQLSRPAFLLAVAAVSAVAWVVLYLFYGFWWVGFLGIPLSLFAPRFLKKFLVAKRKERLVSQFNEMLYALSGSMQAGKSIETAFIAIYKDMELLYPEPHTEIMRELRCISANLNAGVPLDIILKDFAIRSHDEDIGSFVDVYATTKQIGGNLVQVIRSTSEVIADKVAVHKDIQVAIASAKFEHQVLLFVPIGVILMIRAISPGYLDSLYGTIPGVLLSTFALILIGIAWVIGNKITDIKV